MARPGSGNPTFIGGRPTPAATGLLVAVVASYLVLLAIGDDKAGWVASHFGLIPERALGWEPWRLLSGALVNRFMTALFGALGIWFFVPTVEQQIGRNRTLTLFVVAHILSATAVAGVGRLLHVSTVYWGCPHASTAFVVGMGILYGQVPIRVWGMAELKGRTLAMIIVGLGLVIAVINQDWPNLAGDLVGAGVGWVMLSTGGLARIDLLWQRWKLKRLRRRYRVIPGGRDDRRYLN